MYCLMLAIQRYINIQFYCRCLHAFMHVHIFLLPSTLRARRGSMWGYNVKINGNDKGSYTYFLRGVNGVLFSIYVCICEAFTVNKSLPWLYIFTTNGCSLLFSLPDAPKSIFTSFDAYRNWKKATKKDSGFSCQI